MNMREYSKLKAAGAVTMECTDSNCVKCTTKKFCPDTGEAKDDVSNHVYLKFVQEQKQRLADELASITELETDMLAAIGAYSNE